MSRSRPECCRGIQPPRAADAPARPHTPTTPSKRARARRHEHGHESYAAHDDDATARRKAHDGEALVHMAISPRAGDEAHDDDDEGEEPREELVESVGGDDVLEECRSAPSGRRRQYKIQEVIKRPPGHAGAVGQGRTRQQGRGADDTICRWPAAMLS